MLDNRQFGHLFQIYCLMSFPVIILIVKDGRVSVYNFCVINFNIYTAVFSKGFISCIYK